MRFFRGNVAFRNFGAQNPEIPTISAPTQPFQISLGRVAIVDPFQETMSSPTNEIKARTKLPTMLFPYLVMLLILLPFVLFRKHSGLVRHNLCSARRRVKWCVRKCAGRLAFLHRKSHLWRSLIPKFFVRGGGGHPLALPRSNKTCTANGSRRTLNSLNYDLCDLEI
jgi:hypothetical protein